MNLPNPRALISWCFYEWASSSFAIIITTFIFATYFTSHIAVNPVIGTSQWANAMALAGFIIAFLSPISGAIADYSGHKKTGLGLSTCIAVLCSALLWFAYPTVDSVHFTLACVVMGTVGLELALVFYNSFLPTLAPSAYIGRISGFAWGMGYMGGIILLSIALFGFIKSPPSWLNQATAGQVRITGPLVAVWYGLFSLPLFFWVKESAAHKHPFLPSIKAGLQELKKTLKTLPQQKNLTLYLFAHLIYIDGLNTLFAFGGIYAAGTFNMDLQEVLLLGLTMNIAAGIGAIFLAAFDDRLGSKPMILISLFFLLLFGMLILIVKTRTYFWIFGVCLSVFVGPVQAASRSLMARITPQAKSAEMFGLYAFSGRITTFLGPAILGMTTLHFGSQRAGMASILGFFIVGGILLCWVREKDPLAK